MSEQEKGKPKVDVSRALVEKRIAELREEGNRGPLASHRLCDADMLEGLLREVERLTRELRENQALCSSEADARTRHEQQIDDIADALGDESEWSNLNDRGDEAIILAKETVSERDHLRTEVARLTDENERLHGERSYWRGQVAGELAKACTGDSGECAIRQRCTNKCGRLQQMDDAYRARKEPT